MKVIFLDVDGVLNCSLTKERTKTGYVFVEERFIKQVKRIVDATDARIILSSDWRCKTRKPYPSPEFYELQNKLYSYAVYLSGTTPEFDSYVSRGKEIEAWFQKHNSIESFVILDDRKDVDPYVKNLVHIEDGIQDEHVEMAIKILNKD